MKVSAVTITSPYLKEDKAALVEITSKPYFLLSPIEIMDRYAISFFIKSDKEQTITLMYGDSYKDFQVNTEWLKISWTFKAEHVDNLAIRFDVGSYYLYNTQLERGSVATDYNKSPDDSQKEITEIETISLQRYNEVVQSLDEYKVEVGKTYTTKTEYEQTKAQVKVNADQIGLMVESNDDKSEIVLTDKMIKAITTQFVVTSEDGTSTIIEGGTINLEQLFAQDITATGTIRGVTIITDKGNIGGWEIQNGYLRAHNPQISDNIALLNSNQEAHNRAIMIGEIDYGTETEPYAPFMVDFDGTTYVEKLITSKGANLDEFLIEFGDSMVTTPKAITSNTETVVYESTETTRIKPDYIDGYCEFTESTNGVYELEISAVETSSNIKVFTKKYKQVGASNIISFSCALKLMPGTKTQISVKANSSQTVKLYLSR